MKSIEPFLRRRFFKFFLLVEFFEGILKRTTRTIPVKFGWIWPSSIVEEVVLRNCLRTESNQNSSPCEPLALRWANNLKWLVVCINPTRKEFSWGLICHTHTLWKLQNCRSRIMKIIDIPVFSTSWVTWRLVTHPV